MKVRCTKELRLLETAKGAELGSEGGVGHVEQLHALGHEDLPLARVESSRIRLRKVNAVAAGCQDGEGDAEEERGEEDD